MRENRKRTGAAAAASVLLAFIFGLAVYQTMGFVYAIADDVIMRDIASGAFTGTPGRPPDFRAVCAGLADKPSVPD